MIIQTDENGAQIEGTQIELPSSWLNISNPTLEQMYEFGFVDYVQPEPVPVIFVPHDITMRQCQQYLYNIDDGATLAAIEALIPTFGTVYVIDWRTNPPVWRSSPFVEIMRCRFEWTPEQMDEMFIAASLL